MELSRLSSKNRILFDEAFDLYVSAFPCAERRDAPEQLRVLQKEDYHFDLLLDGSTLLGIMLYWQTDDFIYLEHFATMPALRGQGLGAVALELLKQKGKTIILEIEPPEDTLTKRRCAFYERNGFSLTTHHHIQAKYHLGDEDLILKILSFPHPISKEEYIRFRDYLQQEVGIQA